MCKTAAMFIAIEILLLPPYTTVVPLCIYPTFLTWSCHASESQAQHQRLTSTIKSVIKKERKNTTKYSPVTWRAPITRSKKGGGKEDSEGLGPDMQHLAVAFACGEAFCRSSDSAAVLDGLAVGFATATTMTVAEV
jgi:hypothetical protein